MNMKKPTTTWKPHYHTTSTWAFFQLNNNQVVDLIQNQIIWSIICHNETIGPKILTELIRCQKWFIACHKSNGVTTMKNHVELKHSVLLKRYGEKVNKQLRSWLECDQPPSVQMLPQVQLFLDFSPLLTSLKNIMKPKLFF